jgi:NADPH-dependent 2,4-dienoyl-CoA reductase/sulfur reductase-like enzyme/nitrite reductase/ring-hydroxylating ferredoxin subunit
MEQRVAGRDDLADGQMMVVLVNGKKTLLARIGDEFHATAARCPHWGGPLHEGTLNSPRLLCPWHMSTFDVRSGVLLEPPALDGIATYRARVEGDDVYIDRDEAAEAAPGPVSGRSAAGDDRRFVIVGGGAAASAAAEALRNEGFEGRIVMISPEDRWPYDRPNLSKDYLAGELDDKWLPLRGPDFYAGLSIERVTATVTSLDVETRTIVMDDGATLVPDAVLIASGARPRRLDVPGAELSGVMTLRTWDDAEALAAAARDARRAVVVGASFIGMETAASLVRRGLEVTVVAPESVPFELALGRSVGEVVQRKHSERGTRFALGHGVRRFMGDGVVSGVELEDGQRLDADLVVVGIGVTPVTGYVRGVEPDRDGGLPVDEHLRVAPGVWAAGDVARFRESHTGRQVRIEHWRLAQQHGRSAAKAMAGRDTPFRGVPFFWTQHFDLSLGYAGAGHGWEDSFIVGDLKAGDFTSFYTIDDRLIAATGTQNDEIGAFIELMAANDLPAPSELRGMRRAGLADLLRRRRAGLA